MKTIFDIDTWQEIYSVLRKNMTRTIITMIGVMWGIFILVALLATAKGFENRFNKNIGDLATNSVFVWGQSTGMAFHGFQENRPMRLKLSDAMLIQEQVEGIGFVVPRNRNQQIVLHKFLDGNYGVAGDYPLVDKVAKKKLMYGRFINKNDITYSKKIAVISQDVYEDLFEENEDPIGELIEIGEINYTVVGVFERSNINMGPPVAIHIPFTTFQKVFNQGDNIGWMVITGKPEYDISQIESDVKLLLKNLHDVHPEDSRAFGSFNLGERFAEVTGFLTGMQFLTVFVGLATLIAGIFAIGNILLITVKERTKEIGIRRALGAKPWEIKLQIIIESVVLSLFAGILGIIGAGGVVFLINYVSDGPDAVLLNSSVEIYVILSALLTLVVLGTLIGLIPANRAIRIKPIEALRDE
ncbi:ABC transporter permease [Lutimonas halocynthiae]|uniref:ABC transporter permease n=1 Tax=Lutimonas halocynthiae TaxID=1446477 RepID=UPI0025B410BA|nr:ABC transporter permease [Lutimonas halocynthiae]MDN3644179.1 ABC transporter permease [Lutimonas halocynthiae]